MNLFFKNQYKKNIFIHFFMLIFVQRILLKTAFVKL